LGIGAAVGYGGTHIVNFFKEDRIPSAERIQTGYADPDKLGFKLIDLDRDGNNETIMRYEGKSYLLKLDKTGKPIVQTYRISIEDRLER